MDSAKHPTKVEQAITTVFNIIIDLIDYATPILIIICIFSLLYAIGKSSMGG